MSILSIYEAQKSVTSKLRKARTYLQNLVETKNQSKLVDQATTVNPMGMTSMVGKDSDYNRDKITKYLG